MRKTTLLTTLAAAVIAVVVMVGGAAAAGGADLTINKQQSPRNPVHVGAVLSYVIFVGNNGPDAAIGVVLVDTLPASFTFISATPQKGSCTEAANVVSCRSGRCRLESDSCCKRLVTWSVFTRTGRLLRGWQLL